MITKIYNKKKLIKKCFFFKISAAYFYAGNSRAPGNGGFRLRDENGNPEVIRRYRKESVTLTLPEGKTLNNIKWFSVWCEEFAVSSPIFLIHLIFLKLFNKSIRKLL